jgi:hypothetical protein
MMALQNRCRCSLPCPIQNEKALFLQCHMVVKAVKIIYEIGIGNDVLNRGDYWRVYLIR